MLPELKGLFVGGLLLAAVTVWGWLLGRKAAGNVRRFREERHKRFTRRENP